MSIFIRRKLIRVACIGITTEIRELWKVDLLGTARILRKVLEI